LATAHSVQVHAARDPALCEDSQVKKMGRIVMLKRLLTAGGIAVCFIVATASRPNP
jgi:hypothetical protein